MLALVNNLELEEPRSEVEWLDRGSKPLVAYKTTAMKNTMKKVVNLY